MGGFDVSWVTATSSVLKRQFDTVEEWKSAKCRRAYLRNKEARKEYQRGYDADNRHENRRRTADWKKNFPERKKLSDKKSHKKNRSKRLAGMKAYDKVHRHQITERQRNRRKNDPVFSLIDKQRSRLRTAMKRTKNKKHGKTAKLIGCSTFFLHEHVAQQLLAGEAVSDLDVDHIFPCDAYDFVQNDEQYKCFNYVNLQPIPAADNRSKSNRLPTKAMAAKVPNHLWPPGVTEDMLPDIYDGWATPLRM